MSRTTPEQNKALVLEAFDTLFDKRDYHAAERFWSDHDVGLLPAAANASYLGWVGGASALAALLLFRQRTELSPTSFGEEPAMRGYYTHATPARAPSLRLRTT
jgi:hypothetical protein